MKERVIEIKANSVEEARNRLQLEEVIVLEETILCQGKVEIIEAVANSVEEAFIKAKSKVPVGAKTESEKIKVPSQRIMLQVEADNEEGAGKGKAQMITSVSLVKKGKKGFFGFGKTPNVYEVAISQQAVVELTFREKAVIRAKVRGYLAEDLLQSTQEIRLRNPEWTELRQILNPKNDSETETLITKIFELNPISALDTVEDVCRTNEKFNWQAVLGAVHKKFENARARELEEQKVRQRELDVEIAETLMLFTSVHWSKKSYQTKRTEPTGLRRIGYGENNVADPNLRITIPRYSTDEKAFCELEERIEGFALYRCYSELLSKEGRDETTATLEQKCIAALQSRKLQLGM